MIVVKTRNGYITSYREAWKDWGNKPVWTWRTDGPEPLDFGTEEAAQGWIYEVWVGSSAKERAHAAWIIKDITPSPDEAGLIRVSGRSAQ